MLTFESGGFEITVRDEPTYTPRSADNARSYDREVIVGDPGRVSSRHGVVVRGSDGAVRASCILLGGAGPTTVHAASALVRDAALYVACGDSICALALPDLAAAWQRPVDAVSCFGVHPVPGGADLISHGELSIARLTSAGDVVWSASGRDIFTGPFAVEAGTVRAIDWDGVPYVIALETGEILSPAV